MKQDVITLRPVTPLGIIANNLERLCSLALDSVHRDHDFETLLFETSRLANGLEPYLERNTTPASVPLRELADQTMRRNWDELYEAGATAVRLEAEMVSGHVEGQLLKLLVGATGATRVLEVGLFTGYSALAMAEALPDHGRLVACEIDRFAANVARESFDRSPHGGKIRVEIGPALDTLAQMRDDGDVFDFIFIDADKGRYTAYLELVLGSSLLSAEGLVCIDNTLMQGEPYLDGVPSPNGRAIAEFNRFVAEDPRIEHVLLPVRDGLTLIRRC